MSSRRYQQPERPEGWGVIGDWRQYFEDPALDRLNEIVMDLAAATWSVIDRQRILEWVLEERGQLRSGEVDEYQPTAVQEDALTAERNSFMAKLLSGLTRQSAGQ